MHCSIPTLNIALVFIIDDTRRFNVIQVRKKSLAIGNINTIPSLRRIYQAKMTACPMQIFKKGKLGIVKHKS